MNSSDLEKSKQAVESILNAFEVTKVVYVDDANSGDTPLIENVVASALNIGTAMLKELFPELNAANLNDSDILKQHVKEVWLQLEPSTQLIRGTALLQADQKINGTDICDEIYVSILSGLVSEEKLVNLSPAQWEEQENQYIQASKDERILFLFDRDFSNANNVGDSDGGIKIIEKLLGKNDTGNLICGLLTHTINPETMLVAWEDISKNRHIPKDRFIVIPKLHLTEEPVLFAQALKFVALSPAFSDLKSQTKKILSDAVEAAANKIQEIDIYDLDHIVLKVAAAEGLWEPDMLFRLHSLFHHEEARRLAHEDGKLETIAAKLRTVSGIPIESNTFRVSQNAWTIQQQELYELGDHINKNHLPIELGDIFERVDGNSPKKFILLAQPCDLMIRSNGKRNPELHRIPLIEISPPQDDKVPYYSEELPYFGQAPTEKWFVKFKVAHFIRYCILDLCAFNDDGRSQITLDDQVPSRLRPALKNRFEMLTKRWKKAVQKADVLLPANNDGNPVKLAKRQIEEKLRDLLFGEDIFSGKLSESPEGIRTITCNCRRIARLSKDRAVGLLMSYTANLSRPAYERDFAEGLSDC